MDISASLVGCLLLTIMSGCHSQTTLKAKIGMAGIQGDVTFTSQGVNQPTFFTFALTGISGAVNWEIRNTWVDYTVEEKCADSVIGPRVLADIGSTVTTGQETGQFPLSWISDIKVLLGRSILLTFGNNKACGTFMKQSTTYETAFVRLQGKINGDIWFRQGEGESTEIWADLFDPSSQSTVSYDWKIYTGTSTNCSTSSTVFNPTGAGACAGNNPTACPIGDLSGKNGQLPVGQSMGTNVKFMHDINLPLSGSNTVVGKHLVIVGTNNNIVSCGMIMVLNGKQVRATFNKDGVVGTIGFTQKSPFDITSVSVTLAGLHSAAGGYHVHLYPVPVEIESTDSLCSQANVGGHLNPFNQPYPQNAGVTTDQFEVGDLSGKFGLLSGKESLVGNYEDYNLPLFGRNSVVGRSLVIHKSLPNAPRWICANLEDVGARTAAIVTLQSSVIGTVIFSQSQDDPMSDTWIYGELNYADGTMSPTVNHMWMLLDDMVPNARSGSGDACASLGTVYNPFNVKIDGDYSATCEPSNPFRCQVGDGTGQAGKLSIRTDTKLGKKFFLTVRNMPLSGHGNIVGKSMLIYAANSGPAKLACANIYYLRTREAIVDSWTTDVTGYFKFSQEYSHISNPTLVSINVTGMKSLAGNYHVHVFPVPKTDVNPCSDSNVAGHYNPFNVNIASSPPPTTGTYDKYEVGDLSGKNGRFENKNSYDGSYKDNMLNLFGVRSVVGRSVVIHRMSDGSRWSCGNIREDVAMTAGKLHVARANFSGSDVQGHVMLTQYIYPDGAMSDTTVYLYANYTNGRAKTMGHKISVGSKPAFGDMKSTSNKCASTSTTFNPFQVNTQAGYDECSIYNPLRCAVGDISGKQGTYDVGGGKMLVTDVNLPLYGKHSVVGLSFVIGAANGGSAKLACANIMPENATMTTINTDSKSGNKLMEMANKYATALQTSPWNVAVFGNEVEPSCGSSYIVYFMGPEATDLKTKFEALASKRDSSLGDFKPTTCTADKMKISVLLVTMVVLLKKVLL